jgi:hypothetical protein
MVHACKCSMPLSFLQQTISCTPPDRFHPSCRASLNLSTYVTLSDCGYRSLYEPGPSVDTRASRLEFEPVVDPSLRDGFESATMRSP